MLVVSQDLTTQAEEEAFRLWIGSACRFLVVVFNRSEPLPTFPSSLPSPNREVVRTFICSSLDGCLESFVVCLLGFDPVHATGQT